MDKIGKSRTDNMPVRVFLFDPATNYTLGVEEFQNETMFYRVKA